MLIKIYVSDMCMKKAFDYVSLERGLFFNPIDFSLH